MKHPEIAPCGTDCVNCELYEKGGKPESWERLAKATGRTIEESKCKGCHLQPGCIMHANCETLACVNDHEVDYCYECGEFPCQKLMPMAFKADFYPHNLKMYNLCRLKLLGKEKFLEEATRNRALYYKGTMKIGAGPQLEE